MSDSLRKCRLSLISSLIAFLLFQFSSPNLAAQTRPDAKDLLKRMTIEEKVAQLSQLPGFPIPEFIQQVGNPEGVIRKYGAGSVLWVSDPKQINRIQHIAVDESPLHIPILFGLDVIHGYHTIFLGS
jgi:beta-glucosidase